MKKLINPGAKEEEAGMTGYKFFLENDFEDLNLFGILPERRKDHRRITQRSIMKWGKLAAGGHADPNRIHFIKVDLEK